MFETGAALLVGFIPGALLFRMPVANRDRRLALDPEERIFWAVLISLTLSTALVFGLATFNVYTFRRLLTINALASLIVVLVWRKRLLLPETAAALTWTAILPAGLLLIGAWLYLPPFEYVLGGRDPGVYFNEGIRIAQRGSLVVNDPVVASVPEETRSLFMRTSPSTRVHWGLRFMGTFIHDPVTGAVRLQFPEFFPASIALGYSIDGLTGARRMLGVWGVLGVLALYFAGTRLFGRAVGGAAAALLAVHVVQVWFSRYPASEIMMQPLLLGGLLAFARAHQDDDPFFAPVAGWLLALPFMFRVEGALIPVAVATAIAIGFIDRRRPKLWFVVVFMAVMAVAGWYLAEVTTSYFRYPMTVVRGTFRRLPLAIWLTLTVATICLAPLSYLAVTNDRWRAAIRRWLPGVLSLVLLAAAAYAWSWRTESRQLAEYDVQMLRNYSAFYVTFPGLIAALAGYLITSRRALWRDPAFLITATAYAFFYFYKIRIVPEHFWLMRRFLPIVLPATLLFIAAAAFFGLQQGRATRLGRVRQVVSVAIGVVFLGILGSRYLKAAWPVAQHVEYAGVIPRLEELASRFKDDDLLILESRNSSDLHTLGLPLYSIYARNVLLLRSPVPNKEQLERFISVARERYADVYFLGGSGTDLLTPAIAVERVSREQFSIPEYEQGLETYPLQVRLKAYDFGIYRFVDPAQVGEPFALDMDESDDISLLRFYAPEQSGGDTFRWSGARSYATILGITPQRRTITLLMSSGGRPAAAAPASVNVQLNEEQLGTVVVSDGFHPYTFEVPEHVAAGIASGTGSARLALVTTPWVPKQALNVADDRELGVAVSRIELK